MAICRGVRIPYALDLQARVDRRAFFEIGEAESQEKMRERLFEAALAGELPDYMLEYVKLLRMREKAVAV